MKKSSFFVKHALSGDETNLHSCCCLKHGYSKPKCHSLHNVQIIFVPVQRTAQKSFRIFLQTRIMIDGAKFNSHDSGSHFKKSTFKNGCQKKNSYIVVTELKLQVRLSMQSLHMNTFLLVWKKISTFLKKKMGDEAEVVQCPFKIWFIKWIMRSPYFGIGFINFQRYLGNILWPPYLII